MYYSISWSSSLLVFSPFSLFWDLQTRKRWKKEEDIQKNRLTRDFKRKDEKGLLIWKKKKGRKAKVRCSLNMGNVLRIIIFIIFLLVLLSKMNFFARVFLIKRWHQGNEENATLFSMFTCQNTHIACELETYKHKMWKKSDPRSWELKLVNKN